jgi:hypothetical protein
MPVEMAHLVHYDDTAISDKGLTAKFCLTNCTTGPIGRWNFRECHERAHLLSCP